MSEQDTAERDELELERMDPLVGIVGGALRRDDRAQLRSLYRDVIDAGQLHVVRVKAGHEDREEVDLSCHAAQLMAETAAVLYGALWPEE